MVHQLLTVRSPDVGVSAEVSRSPPTNDLSVEHARVIDRDRILGEVVAIDIDRVRLLARRQPH